MDRLFCISRYNRNLTLYNLKTINREQVCKGLKRNLWSSNFSQKRTNKFDLFGFYSSRQTKQICLFLFGRIYGLPICFSKLSMYIPYSCSHFYFDIKFGNILYSKENRLGSGDLFSIEYNHDCISHQSQLYCYLIQLEFFLQKILLTTRRQVQYHITQSESQPPISSISSLILAQCAQWTTNDKKSSENKIFIIFTHLQKFFSAINGRSLFATQTILLSDIFSSLRLSILKDENSLQIEIPHKEPHGIALQQSFLFVCF